MEASLVVSLYCLTRVGVLIITNCITWCERHHYKSRSSQSFPFSCPLFSVSPRPITAINLSIASRNFLSETDYCFRQTVDLSQNQVFTFAPFSILTVPFEDLMWL